MRSIKVLCLFVFLFLIGSPTYAQPKRGLEQLLAPHQLTNGRPLNVALARTQACEKSPDDIEAVRKMKDVGFDLAIVVAEQSTIREDSSVSSKALKSVKRSDFLALVKRDPVSSWYRVVEIDSATEGWINECDVIIKLTANPESGPQMEEESTGTTGDPVLNISNLEPTTSLNLRLNGVLYVIPANTTKTLTVKPGKYEYYGYSPGIRPAAGNRDFKAGYKYTWTFKIIRR